MSKIKSLGIGGITVPLMLAAAWLSFYDCGTVAADYSFSMDRFEVSGQVNQSDEFNDYVVDPLDWVIHDPTVEESDGFVSFSNPGTIESGVLDGFNYLVEMSFIGSKYDSRFVVENGSGDFTGISRWAPIIPGLNQWYKMQVGYELQKDPHEAINIGVCVANWDSDFAGIMGINPGFGISFYRSGENRNWQHFPISESDITGDVLLKLYFEDASDKFTPYFSLDGGVTFQNPFVSIDWGITTTGHYEWYFSGEAIELQVIPVPGAIVLGSLGLSFVGWKLRKRKEL